MLGTKLFAKLKTILKQTEADFNEFEPRLKCAKKRFELIEHWFKSGNIEYNIQVEPTIFEPRLKFKSNLSNTLCFMC